MIKKIIFMCLGLVIAVSISNTQANAARLPLKTPTNAKLLKVCPKYRELGDDQYKNNSPVRAVNGDNSSGITRFALNPTIIFVDTQPATLGTANAYDKKGNLVLTAAQRLGCDARPRGVCFTRYKASESRDNTRKVRRAAVANTGSPEIFWRVSKSLCIRVADAGKCYNVKSREYCTSGTVVK